MRNDLTQERLKQLFSFDPEAGVFTRMVTRGGELRGSISGCVQQDGYLVICIDRVNYLAHRLAWFYVHGSWPDGDIDHRDGVRSNNRLANLRAVDRSTNNENRKRATVRNATGFLGVSRVAGNLRAPYRAQITVRGKGIGLGYFSTPEAAHSAYLAAKRQLHEGNTL